MLRRLSNLLTRGECLTECVTGGRFLDVHVLRIHAGFAARGGADGMVAAKVQLDVGTWQPSPVSMMNLLGIQGGTGC